MENFYKDMTYMAVYDGHGSNGRPASDLANNTIRHYLMDNKETLYAIEVEEDMERFFKKMCSKVQEQYQIDTVDYQLTGTCAIMVWLQ